jgi:hypothetical protein
VRAARHFEIGEVDGNCAPDPYSLVISLDFELPHPRLSQSDSLGLISAGHLRVICWSFAGLKFRCAANFPHQLNFCRDGSTTTTLQSPSGRSGFRSSQQVQQSQFLCGRELLPNSSITSKIPSHTPARLPSNIPLRTIASRSAQTSLLASSQPGPASQRSSDSTLSSESWWTDTGDIAEQLADEEDHPRIRLAGDLDDELLASVVRRQPRLKQKRVRIQASPTRRCRSDSHAGVVSKEFIEIPEVVPRPPTRLERLIAHTMAAQSSSIHGLTGRPLMSVYRRPGLSLRLS